MTELKCNCGKTHRAPLKKYIIESGAVQKTVEILRDYSKIYLVCDETTYGILGLKVEMILSDAGKLSHKLILKTNPLPDAQTIGDILIHLMPPSDENDIFGYSDKPDLILGVGSGTINDSCRLVSYRIGVPYAIVATAPSMDGYASAGSPTLFDGSKATIKCTTPRYIIADTDVIKDAPMDMLFSGIGDMFGKYTGILDWELARDYNGDYYCEQIARDVLSATDACLLNGYQIQTRGAECIESIMHGFMVSGLGMAFTGNSRPASGAEHIIAHVWEIEDVKDGKKPNLHGLEVCQATRIVIYMYRLLMQETSDEHLRKMIERYIPYFDKVEEFCLNMDMPCVTCDKEKMVRSVFKAVTLRDRYTILFYLRDKGLLERYTEYAVDRFIEKTKI